MKARILLTVALAVVLLTAGGISAAPAAGDGAVVPFKATIQTFPRIVSRYPYLVVEIPGEGQATHLGKTVFYSDMNAYFNGLQDGTMVFTAANGDQLVGGFEGIGDGQLERREFHDSDRYRQ
jgi:hypothetical protein